MSTKKSRGPRGAARPPLITLFTDFGLGDPFVGVMKGVILGICPQARIVDLGHDAARFDPLAAGFALATAVAHFPAGTIHVAVVDPGVGGPRRPLAARIGRHLFVAPDNGILGWVLAAVGRAEVRAIADPRLMRHPVSATFHGRDVFAPAAANLALGYPFARVGPRVADPVRPSLPRPALEPGPALRGQVVWVDRFGNLITNVDGEALAALGAPAEAELHVVLTSHPPVPVVSHYGAVGPGSVAAVLGSTGHLEIFANRGSAADALGAGPGTSLRVRPVPHRTGATRRPRRAPRPRGTPAPRGMRSRRRAGGRTGWRGRTLR
jgi:S-adenosyl-L-methionine hydrolase (adenosine-forming)